MMAKFGDMIMMALIGAGAIAGMVVFLIVIIAVLLSDDWRDED